jgi:aspartate-semialdehyde dehydrogenase
VGFALPLKPLIDSFGVSYVNVVTMQSVSGRSDLRGDAEQASVVRDKGRDG